MGLFSPFSSGRAAAGRRAPCDPIPTQFLVRHIYQEGKVAPVGWEATRKVQSNRTPKASVKRLWGKSGYLLAEIVYPNCPTFEGRKLILFAGVTAAWLRAQTAIDPHFTEGGHIVARFAPTPEGLRLAKRYLT